MDAHVRQRHGNDPGAANLTGALAESERDSCCTVAGAHRRVRPVQATVTVSRAT
jgi:hypothetical protein